jgi:hypothetical protein
MSFEEQWTRCEPWLAAALERYPTATLNDVKARVLAATAQFWPRPDAAAVTEIVTYDRAKVCRVWLAGGNLRTIVAAQPEVEAWARGIGCTGMEIIGRPGWERALGYRNTAVVLAKEL